MQIEDFFRENPKVALGFSGGVDSAFLLYMGVKCGADIRPYFVKSPFQPEFELEDAKRLAQELGVELVVLEHDVLASEEVAANPANRCYYCKTGIFSLLLERAREDGYQVILDGTNASDDVADRPGMKALSELQVKSPLRECGLTKAEIRRLSKEAGLFTWNKPAYACLATRVPTGRRITKELLQKVEAAEGCLFQMGFSDFRVRIYEDAARIQWKKEELGRAVELMDKIREQLTPYFKIVLYDTEVR